MAFFGLTALGPQNPFADAAITSTVKSAPLIHIFSDDDYRKAWRRAVGAVDLSTPRSNLPRIYKEIFLGPVPDIDLKYLNNAFESDAEDIDIDTYIQILGRLRDNLETLEAEAFTSSQPKYGGQLKNAAVEVHSVEKLKERNQRHIRYKRAPNEKQTYPLTSAQEYGWQPPERLAPPSAGIKESPVTKYAAELTKSGVYY